MDGELVVLVVDDDEADRTRTTAILRSAGFAARPLTGSEATRVALDPDTPVAAAVVDVTLDGITGYEICRRLRDAHGNGIGIIFTSRHRTDPIDRVAGLLLGADDYLPEPYLPDELTARVLRLVRHHRRRTAWGGGGGRRQLRDVGNNGHRPGEGADELGTPVRAGKVGRSNHNGASAAGDHRRPYDLTDREMEVLQLLASGLSQAEVSRVLRVSPATVGTHIQRILGKLDVHNRAQAVALAHREGLVGDG